MSGAQEADSLVDLMKSRLSHWLDELGLISDMAANSERTGVPPDARSGERAKTLLRELQEVQAKIDATKSDIPAKAVQKKVVKAVIDVLHDETKAATHGLRAEI